MEISINKMLPIFNVAHKSENSVHMIGLHGVGKSKIVEKYCKDNNIHLEILMLSTQDVSDLIGMPGDEIIERDGKEVKVMTWSQPAWLERMHNASKEGKHCCLFLDELARAPLEVRQGALSLVLDHKIHEHKLPKFEDLETLVIAADNPSELYQTDELDDALLDRFMSFSVKTSAKEWLKWANENDILDVVKDFIAEYPDNIHNQFPDEAEKDKGSTPRAWEKLSDALKVAEEEKFPKNMMLPMIISKVGNTVGNSFYLFYNNYLKVLKPEDIIDTIGDKKIDDEESMKEVSKSLSPKTQKLEHTVASQLAEKLRKMIEEDELSPHILSTYLGSLNLEVMMSIVKAWKESKEDQDFYYEWSETVPNLWLFLLIMNKRS